MSAYNRYISNDTYVLCYPSAKAESYHCLKKTQGFSITIIYPAWHIIHVFKKGFFPCKPVLSYLSVFFKTGNYVCKYLSRIRDVSAGKYSYFCINYEILDTN